MRGVRWGEGLRGGGKGGEGIGLLNLLFLRIPTLGNLSLLYFVLSITRPSTFLFSHYYCTQD